MDDFCPVELSFDDLFDDTYDEHKKVTYKIDDMAWINWRVAVKYAFADYAATKTFPPPPRALPCSKLECSASARDRNLIASPCNVTAAIKTLDKTPARLKPQRLA